MAVTGVTSQGIYIGAGDLFYKDAAGIWQPAGATVGDNMFLVTRKYYSADLNGVIGPIIGTDYIVDELAELECSPAEISVGVMGLLVADAASTTSAVTATGTVNTTLADVAASGQSLAIKVAAVTGMSVGTFVKIGTAPTVEYRKITRVGTALIGGTGIDLDYPLILAHPVAEPMVSVVGDGTTVITSGTNRRLPSTAYHDWYLEVPGLDGRNARFVLKNAVCLEPASYTFSDSKEAAPKVKITARRDPASPLTPAYSVIKVPTYTV